MSGADIIMFKYSLSNIRKESGVIKLGSQACFTQVLIL